MVMGRKSLSAGYGINSWLYQRITALIMLLAIVVVFALVILAHDMVGASQYTWKEYFNCILVKVIAQLTIAAIVLHAWVGIRDLWMDYVKPIAIRLALYTFTILWLAGSFIYSLYILWA